MKTINNDLTQHDIDKLEDELTRLEMLQEIDFKEEREKEIKDIKDKINSLYG